MSDGKHPVGGTPAVRLAWYGPYAALLVGFETGPVDVEVPDISDPLPLPGWGVHVAGTTLVKVIGPGRRWSVLGEEGHPLELPAEWLAAARQAGGVLIVLNDSGSRDKGQDLGGALTAANDAGRFGLAPVIPVRKA